MNSTAISAEDVKAHCATFIAEQLRRPAGGIDPDMEFDDFGLDSALVTAMLIDLEEWLKVELSPSLVFEEPTLNRLSRAICRRLEAA